MTGKEFADSVDGPRRNEEGESSFRLTYAEEPLPESARGTIKVSNDDIHDDSTSVGYVGAGLQWLRRQRELRRKQLLALQVEQQRRRLLAASRQGSHKSLDTNPTFQQLSASASFTDPSSEETENGGVKVSDPTITRSGDGISVSLKLDEEELAALDMIVKEVRIQQEPADGVHQFCPFILTQAQMLEICRKALPPGIAFCKWNRRYSLARDGDSFDSFMRRVQGLPRSLLVVKTTTGHVLGGYADSPWETRPQGNLGSFYGSAQACLFSCVSDKVVVHKWTGRNRYIQFLDVTKKQLAFGGGGGSFGLCVEQDFERGSTGRCDTFGNEPLCEQENFKIMDVEAWEFLTGQF